MPSSANLGTGRRKTATARIHLTVGTGKITVNGRAFENYFTVEQHRGSVLQPFVVTATTGKFDVAANVSGGGPAGQAGAVRDEQFVPTVFQIERHWAPHDTQPDETDLHEAGPLRHHLKNAARERPHDEREPPEPRACHAPSVPRTRVPTPPRPSHPTMRGHSTRSPPASASAQPASRAARSQGGERERYARSVSADDRRFAARSRRMGNPPRWAHRAP